MRLLYELGGVFPQPVKNFTNKIPIGRQAVKIVKRFRPSIHYNPEKITGKRRQTNLSN
jgi:hypothetical protein